MDVPILPPEVTTITQQEKKPGAEGKPEGDMRVLVANEPLAYREVISAALKELRPHLKVYMTEPVDLDEEFVRLSPGLVVCSRSMALLEREAPAWIELYPGHTPGAVVSLARKKSAFNKMDFDALLSALDEAERLYLPKGGRLP